MTTKKPAPAALIANFQRCFRGGSKPGTIKIAAAEYAEAYEALLSALTPQPTLSEKCEAAVDRIVDRAMRGPEASADDAAALDEYGRCCAMIASAKSGAERENHKRSAEKARAAVLARMAGKVQQGYVLVPQKMTVEPSGIIAVLSMCGPDGDEEPSAGILWVGEITGDDGEKGYGLHISNLEYPEEGSETIVELSKPLAAAPAPEGT